VTYYAHTLTAPDGTLMPTDKWEPLYTGPCATDCTACAATEAEHGHINKVSHLTAEFAAALFRLDSNEAHSAAEWGRLIGLWHDLGKFAPQWQTYLASKADDLHRDDFTGKVDHSTAGAQFADKNIPKLGRLIAYLIAGHHTGLANGMDGNAPGSSLEERLRKSIPEHLPHVPESILNHRPSTPPPLFALRPGATSSLAFLLRMLFSCLTDADFLATEACMSPERATHRPRRQPTLSELHTTLEAHLADLAKTALDSPVNRQRADILRACLAAAEKPPGLFSLTVPTGGGKTLSSLAFALDHARRHDLRRVIYVIPYTSIIEQNAAVFRRALAALGPDIVLEHHASLDPDDETKNTARSRLAAENWDARLIVTTNVQFFESLHANRTSRCRKLHRIARSVVILDEAQSLPLELLSPCLRAIEELTTHYGASIVLCTATQPALERRPDFKIGLVTPTEIIPDRARLYTALQRVRTTPLGRLDDDALLPLLQAHVQVLCIVSTRRHARALFECLPRDDAHFHLSALMCAEHRTRILDSIKARLRAGLPVRVISTQLIEAGVDVDFPVVFRSIAGLDSIAQAAGRCDREGKLTAAAGHPAGQLFLFSTKKPPPQGFLRQAAQSAEEVLALGFPDPLGLKAIEAYFRTHYWKHQDRADTHDILSCWPKELKKSDDLLCFQFKTCAEKFTFIEDTSAPVIVPYGDTGRALLEEVRTTYDPGRLRYLARKLQRYTVTVPKAQHASALDHGIIQLLHDRFPLLNSDVHYDEAFGLNLTGSPTNDGGFYA